jgi:hypothetical protein
VTRVLKQREALPTTLDIRLSPQQRAVLAKQRQHRFLVLIAGRRWGKTRFAIAVLAIAAAEKPKSRNWYIAPTREMAKDICWDVLLEVMRPLIVAVNATELTVTLANGSTITLKSADEPDRLRGRALDLVVLDEFAQIARETWDAVIRPALATTQGKCVFIGTPDGRGWAYELFRAAQQDTTGYWCAIAQTTAQGGFVPQEELEEAKASMDPRIYRQEFEATFESALGRVHDAFLWAPHPAGNVSADVSDDPLLPLLVGMDFNVHPMSVSLAVKRGKQLHVFDAWQVPTSNTEEICTMLVDRYPNRLVRVYPDPSGNARKSSAPVGQTDFTILRRHGFNVLAPMKAPAVADRINAVNALLCNAKGERNLLIHPRAVTLLKSLDGLAYKLGTSQPEKAGGFDHACFDGDTLVETPAGVVPIASLPPTGEIRGPTGEWVSYVGAGITKRNAEVVEVTFASGYRVICTPDHQWLTTQGWMRAVDMDATTDYIEVCDIQSSVTRSSSSTASPTIGAAPTSSALACGCIALCTSRCMGQFPMAHTFITSMATQPTTHRTISSPSTPQRTARFTAASLHDKTTPDEHWDTHATPLPHGIAAMPVAHGTASTMPSTGMHSIAPFAPSAPTVAANTTPPAESRLHSVHATATQPHAAHPAWTIRPELARIAAQRSPATATSPHSTAASGVARSHGSIVSVRPVSARDVYDVCVPDVGAFALASGIVVSNCDALGYLVWTACNPLRDYRIDLASFSR